MNCRTFMKKLPEYADEVLLHDMKKAMEKHMESCENCKIAYNEELEFDSLFSEALRIDETKFNSSRVEIIKEIDKYRYGKSPLKKVKFGMRKHRIQLASAAAVLVFVIAAIPLVITPRMNKASQMNKADSKSNGYTISNNENINEDGNGGESKIAASESTTQFQIPLSSVAPSAFADLLRNKIAVPKFNLIMLDKMPDEKLSTAPKDSPDKNTKVSLYGRGPAAIDDEIADIVFQRQKDLSAWKLSVENNEKNQVSPLFVDWYDNDDILVILGNARGHATYGGDLFLVNINTGKALNIYPAHSQNNNQEVVSAVRNGDSLDLAVKEFDDSHNVLRDTNTTIYFNELYSAYNDKKLNNATGEVKGAIVQDKALNVVKTSFADGINNKDSKALKDILGSEFIKSDYQKLNELLGIGKAGILRVIDMTKPSDVDSNETYFVEADIAIKPETAAYKNGVNYLAFKLQKDEQDNWIITSITRLPQN